MSETYKKHIIVKSTEGDHFYAHIMDFLKGKKPTVFFLTVSQQGDCRMLFVGFPEEEFREFSKFLEHQEPGCVLIEFLEHNKAKASLFEEKKGIIFNDLFN